MHSKEFFTISDHLDTPLECHSRHAQFTEGADKFIQKSESHINSDHSLASHGSVPNASKLSILGKGNKVSHRDRQSQSDPTIITDNTKLRIKFPT